MTDLARIKLMCKVFTPSDLKALKFEANRHNITGLFWECAAAEDLQYFLQSKEIIWWRLMVSAIRLARNYH